MQAFPTLQLVEEHNQARQSDGFLVFHTHCLGKKICDCYKAHIKAPLLHYITCLAILLRVKLQNVTTP